jgi:tryptophanyl-tRNA synthetase
VSSEEVYKHYNNAFNECTIRYGDAKKQLAEDMVNFISPIRNKAKDLMQDETYLKKVMQTGAEKATVSAAATLKKVKEVMGLNYF